jgi:uncharacterized protein (DUF1800 family)
VDVYAGARFTGWNLQRTGQRDTPAFYFAFFYNAGQHDTDAKDFSFPIYPDGSRRIPARAASAGMQDGLDLIEAVARHPETGPRLARKLWAFFVSETSDPTDRFVEDVAGTCYRTRPTCARGATVLTRRSSTTRPTSSPTLLAAEFVVRAMKEVGSNGFR